MPVLLLKADYWQHLVEQKMELSSLMSGLEMIKQLESFM